MDDLRRNELIREFFKICPDYALSRTLVDNIAEGNVTRDHALKLLHEKAADARLLKAPIQGVIDKRKVHVEGKWVLLKDMSFEQICHLEDNAFLEVLAFYFKHPYVHGRVPPPSLLKPRVWRTRFLRGLVEAAKKRNLEVDYHEWNDLLSLL